MQVRAWLVAAAIAVGTVPSAGEVGFGIWAGLGGASMWGDDADDAGLRSSFEGGLVVDFQANDWLSVRPGVCLALRGAQWDSTGTLAGVVSWDLESDLLLSCVEIPLDLVAKLPVAWRVRPSAIAGCALGLRVAAQRNVTGTTTDIIRGTLQVDDEDDFDDDINPVDFALRAGIGADIPVSGGALFIEFRFEWSMVELYEDSDWPEIHPFAFVCGIGYHF